MFRGIRRAGGGESASSSGRCAIGMLTWASRPTATPTASGRGPGWDVLAPNRSSPSYCAILGHRGWRGGVGRAWRPRISSTLASRHEVSSTAPRGFEYLGDLITPGRAMFGGEESGGMSLKGHPPKDGVLACLWRRVAAVEGVALGAVGAALRRWGASCPFSERAALGCRAARVAGAIADPQTLGGAPSSASDHGRAQAPDGGAWVLVGLRRTGPVAQLYVEAPRRRDARHPARRRAPDV
jgi:hypothetical protein